MVNTQRSQKKVATSQGKVDSYRDQRDWLDRDGSQISSGVSDGISKCNADVLSHFLQSSEIIHKEHDYAK